MTRTTMNTVPVYIKVVLLITALILTGTLMTSAAGMQIAASRTVTIVTPEGSLEVETNKTLVADIIEAAGITLDEAYETTVPSPNQDLEFDHIIISRAAKITLKADGQELELISWAKTVKDLLQEQNISIGRDIINYPIEESIQTGQVIEITRVDSELIYRETVIPAQTTYKNEPSLVVGKEKVQKPAQDGIKRVTDVIIFNDGVEVSRKTVSEEVVVEPVTGITLRGTQAAASRSPSPPPPSGSNNIIEGIASYYGAKFHGRNTASGVPYDMYALTAAHKTLPFGTIVKVTYLPSGKSVVVEINDRGPFTPGRIIDLSAAAAKEIGLYSAGIGKVRVEILN